MKSDNICENDKYSDQKKCFEIYIISYKAFYKDRFKTLIDCDSD